MSSVGPQLPPHLTKRKRSVDEAEPPNSPPHKVVAASPSVRGPAPPPKNADEIDVDSSSDDDDYGPSAPAPSAASKPPSPPRRVLGPTAPPAPLSQMPSHPPDDDDASSSSDDDDDYGPALPPAPGSAAEAQMLEQRAQDKRIARAAAAAPDASKPQRAEWMITPPTDSDWSTRIDPTKLKNRKFATGKGPKAPAAKSGVSAIWTETPAEKRQRLEDEIMGRREAATASASAHAGLAARVESKEERERERRIREAQEKNRGKSLVEEHQARKGVKEMEDDPSQRAFDREKDMAVGGLGPMQKREIVARAADFGSKFQKGKYL